MDFQCMVPTFMVQISPLHNQTNSEILTILLFREMPEKAKFYIEMLL